MSEPTQGAELVRLKELIEVLWDSLGSGVWLEPGDYEALREMHNKAAQAAEDVCIVGRRALAHIVDMIEIGTWTEQYDGTDRP